MVCLSGDIHIGCIFDISAMLPPTKAVSLTSSGISQIDDTQPLVGTFVDEEFSLAFASVRRFAMRSINSTSASSRVPPVIATACADRLPDSRR